MFDFFHRSTTSTPAASPPPPSGLTKAESRLSLSLTPTQPKVQVGHRRSLSRPNSPRGQGRPPQLMSSGGIYGRSARTEIEDISIKHFRSRSSIDQLLPTVSPRASAVLSKRSKSKSRDQDTLQTMKKSSSSAGTDRGIHTPARQSSTRRHSTLGTSMTRQASARAFDQQVLFQLKNGKKHHAFNLVEAPYPASYDRAVIDHDVWHNAFLQDLRQSVTSHDFGSNPPTHVLDLGCGSGAWIIDAAKAWPDCKFVGLDLVPLQPDLKLIGAVHLAKRITWVQANFLQRLPFPDDYFDFVHIRRIARGVSEDKWDDLFEEVARVMKPGGALEVLEDDLLFPGGSSAFVPKGPKSRENGKKQTGKRKRVERENLQVPLPTPQGLLQPVPPIPQEPRSTPPSLSHSTRTTASPSTSSPQTPINSEVESGGEDSRTRTRPPQDPTPPASSSTEVPRSAEDDSSSKDSTPTPRQSLTLEESSSAADPSTVTATTTTPVPSRIIVPTSRESDHEQPKHTMSRTTSSPPIMRPGTSPATTRTLNRARSSSTAKATTTMRPATTGILFPSRPISETSKDTVKIPSKLESGARAHRISSPMHPTQTPALAVAVGFGLGLGFGGFPIREPPRTPEKLTQPPKNVLSKSPEMKHAGNAGRTVSEGSSRPQSPTPLTVHPKANSRLSTSSLSPDLNVLPAELENQNGALHHSEKPTPATPTTPPAPQRKTHRSLHGIGSSASNLLFKASGYSLSSSGSNLAAPSFPPRGFAAQKPEGSGLASPEAPSVVPTEGPAYTLFHPTPLITHPHDHSYLETAYIEMHSSRFINLNPTSLLSSAMAMVFKDVRSHPRICLGFPVDESGSNNEIQVVESNPRSPREPLTLSTQCPAVASLLTPDTLTIAPQRYPPNCLDHPGTPSAKSLPPAHPSSLTIQSPFIHNEMSMSRLPNKTFRFDMTTLNMHLSQAVTDVLACRESIWDYILERDGPEQADRVEFEEAFKRYEIDMNAQIGLSRALETRFDWKTLEIPPTPERQAYDTALTRLKKQRLSEHSSRKPVSPGDTIPVSTTPAEVTPTATSQPQTRPVSMFSTPAPAHVPTTARPSTAGGQSPRYPGGREHLTLAMALASRPSTSSGYSPGFGTQTPLHVECGGDSDGSEEWDEEEQVKMSRAVKGFVAWKAGPRASP